MSHKTRKPIFSYLSLAFSVLFLILVGYLKLLYQAPEGVNGMLGGLNYVLGAAAALVAGFLCMVIGLLRREKTSLLLKLNAGFSTAVTCWGVWEMIF